MHSNDYACFLSPKPQFYGKTEIRGVNKNLLELVPDISFSGYDFSYPGFYSDI